MFLELSEVSIKFCQNFQIFFQNFRNIPEIFLHIRYILYNFRKISIKRF